GVTRAVPAKSETCAFRRAIPLDRGREEIRTTGEPPRPAKKQGPRRFGCLKCECETSPCGTSHFCEDEPNFGRNDDLNRARDRAPPRGLPPRRPTAACRPARTRRSACRRADTNSRRCAATSA